MLNDMTYCANVDCPIKECERHQDQLKKYYSNRNKIISIADFSGVCEDYIGHLIYEEKLKEGNK